MMILFYERNIDEGGIMTEDRENKIIEERIKGWTAFEYEKFLNEIDREIEKIRKKTKATDKELEIGYKILSPAPTACFIDPVIFMHEKYDEYLWNIKKEQIFSVLGTRKTDIYGIIQYCQLKFVKQSLEEIYNENPKDDCTLIIHASENTIPRLYQNRDFYSFGKIVIEELWYEDTEDEERIYDIICPISAAFFHVVMSGKEETIKTLLSYS